MTRDFQDAQYRCGQNLPGFQDIQDRMTEESASASVAPTRHGFGTDPRQWVETIAVTRPRDVLPVFLNTGYWRALTARMRRYILPALAPCSAQIANADYRVVQHVPLPKFVPDTRSAVKTLAAPAPGASLLPIGHSASAPLAVSALDASGTARHCTWQSP